MSRPKLGELGGALGEFTEDTVRTTRGAIIAARRCFSSARHRNFGYLGHNYVGDYSNTRAGRLNLIVDGRIRVTKVGRWHWNETRRIWVGYGERWDRFAKRWSAPRLFHCREFECEGNTMSQI